MYTRELHSPSGRLVEYGAFAYGSFNGPFGRANILDVERPYHFPVPRPVKDFRINESQSFQTCSDDVFVYLDLYNAKLFTLVYLNVLDRASRRRSHYWRFLPGSRLSIPDSLADSETIFRRGCFDIRLHSHLGAGEIRLRARVSGFRDSPDIALDMRLDAAPGRATALTSVMPLGLNRAVYSYRLPGPAEGRVSIGGRSLRVRADTANAMFCDHKGLHPYLTILDWVAGMGRDSQGRRVAFSMADHHVEGQDKINENALWVDGRLIPLPAVRITRPLGPAGEWIIQDMEGMVDMTFIPETRNSFHVNAIFAESDYHGPFGRFHGWVMDPEGGRVGVDGLYGIGKHKRMRA